MKDQSNDPSHHEWILYKAYSVYMVGNVLFKDIFNTFHLWLYGVRHVVKHHSDNKRGNPLLNLLLYGILSN